MLKKLLLEPRLTNPICGPPLLSFCCRRSTFASNSARSAAGIHAEMEAYVGVSECVFYNNTARENGAAVEAHEDANVSRLHVLHTAKV